MAQQSLEEFCNIMYRHHALLKSQFELEKIEQLCSNHDRLNEWRKRLFALNLAKLTGSKFMKKWLENMYYTAANFDDKLAANEPDMFVQAELLKFEEELANKEQQLEKELCLERRVEALEKLITAC